MKNHKRQRSIIYTALVFIYFWHIMLVSTYSTPVMTSEPRNIQYEIGCSKEKKNNDKDLKKNLKVDTWLKCTNKELKKEFKNFWYNKNVTGFGVRSKYVFIPNHTKFNKHISNTNSSRKLVIITLHGTWAYNFKNYYDPKFSYFRDILNFARNEANVRNVPVEVISFRWAEKDNSEINILKHLKVAITHNTSAVRMQAGKILANLLIKHYVNYEKIIISHSHGCNVTSYASRLIGKKTVIDHIINLATPVRDTTEQAFNPVNFLKLTNFYSNADMVAALGSINTFNLVKWMNTGNRIRKFTDYGVKEIFNVRVQINGKPPGHSEIQKIVPHLSWILAEAEFFKINKDLELNLDTTSSPANIYLAARNFNNWRWIDKLVTDPNYPTSIKSELLLCEKREHARSDFINSLFEKKYGRSISERPGIIKNIFNF